MVLNTYAVHGGNLISIELHSLTHRERHEEEKEEDRACSQRGGEKVKDMLVHARKEAVDTLSRGMCHFQHIYDYILKQNTVCITTLCTALPRDDLSNYACEGKCNLSFLYFKLNVNVIDSTSCELIAIPGHI